MLATVPFMVIFRILHILSGVMWVGATVLFAAFIGPAAGELGPAAGPLMSNLVNKRKLVRFFVTVSTFTVFAGWIMWLRDMGQGGLHNWITSRFGIVLTIGGVLATLAWIEGYLGVGRNVERMVALGDEIAGAGGPPTPEQQSRMQQIQGQLKTRGMADLILLVLAVIAMATARYW